MKTNHLLGLLAVWLLMTATVGADLLDEYGFAYVPRSCTDGEPCQIHVVFHGCKQVYNRNPDASDFSPDDAFNPYK